MVTCLNKKYKYIQGVLAAVLSTVLGTKDPEQVNSMAKQAGEVKQNYYTLISFCFHY